MNPFQKDEDKGRLLLSDLLNLIMISDIEFTKDRFNPVDGFFKSRNKRIVFEIKVRDKKYLNYPSLIIEDLKYQNLLRIKNELNCSCGLYFNFIGDYCYVFNLNKISKFEPQYLYCKNTTSLGTGYKNKLVRYLDKNSAKVFVKVDGLWKG